MTGTADAGGRSDRARRARRPSRWDDPPPRDWRYAVGTLGRVLIATGLLMFGFVAYQLWGTGIEYAQAQNRLDEEFEELLASVTAPTDSAAPAAPVASPDGAAGTGTPASTAVPPTSPATGPAPSTPRPASTAPGTDASTPSTPSAAAPGTAPPATEAPAPAAAADGRPAAPAVATPVAIPAFDDGDVIARIEIPAIGLDAKVVAGVEPGDLKDGPGHYPDTPMPGQLGNSAIAGHRTTYGQPFFHLDRVGSGDRIVVTTVQGRFVYRVTGSEIVAPSAGGVVATTDPTTAKLTLTTCHPRYTAAQRLVVYADLDVAASAAPQPAVLNYGRGTPAAPAPDAPLPGEPVVSAPPADPTVAAADDSPTVTSAAPVPTATTPGAGSAASDPTATPGPDPTVGPAESAAPSTSSAPAAPAITASPPSPAGPPADGVTEQMADAFSHGWFSDDGAYAQVALWGLVLSAIAIGAYLLSRRVRRNWVGALAGITPFLVALYFFYQNVNRLLPAAI